jgi:hypothetical protein
LEEEVTGCFQELVCFEINDRGEASHRENMDQKGSDQGAITSSQRLEVIERS